MAAIGAKAMAASDGKETAASGGKEMAVMAVTPARGSQAMTASRCKAIAAA
jgi:hypothetical protein